MQTGVFLDLVTSAQMPTVLAGVERAVLRSFNEDQQPGRIILVTGARNRAPTRAEQKRRAEICVKIFKVLRGDLSWGVERILDSLPKFLRCELDGRSWEPEARRATWTPT